MHYNLNGICAIFLRRRTPFSLLLFLISYSTFSQVTSSLDSTSIKIGEEVRYKIEVETDTTNIVIFPEGQTFMPMEMIDSYDIDTIRKRNRYNLIKEYGLTQFDSGRFLIPTQKVVVGDKVFSTDSLMVEVSMIEVDTTKQGLYDIKPIIKVEKQHSNWLLYLLVSLLVIGIIAALVYWFIWRKKPLTEEEKIALLPPYDRAKLALKQLDERKYLENSELKQYYSELTFAIRRYLDEKVYDHSLESTTDELIFRLNLLRQGNQIELSHETIKNLESILKRADLVKFAKSNPDKELAIMDRKTVDLEIDHVKESLPEPSEEEKLLDEKYALEKKRKEKRKKLMLTAGVAFLLLAVTYIGFSLKYGFAYVKDTLVGNDSLELLEGEWVSSAYGVPPIYISTPDVLKRVEVKATSENETINNSTFVLGDLTSPISILLSTSRVDTTNGRQPDLYKLTQESLKTLADNGIENIITKSDKFITPNAQEGIKVYGTADFPRGNSSDYEQGEYTILAFNSEDVTQQVVLTWRENDAYADEIMKRLLNSIELKKELDAERN